MLSYLDLTRIGGSGYHMGLSWTWFLWSPSGITWNKMTVIHISASPGPVDSGPYLAIIGTWILTYIPGPHLDLVTQVLIWESWDLVSIPHRGLTWT